MGFRSSVSLLPAILATRLLALTLAGLTPAERTSLCWTHNRACNFHRTRLLGSATGSWSQPSRFPVATYGYWRTSSIYLFVAIRKVSPFPLAKLPVPRQHPFGLGINHIQPVMNSRCLSAAGFCFLEHPFPTEEFCHPYGWLTEVFFRPHWGYHVSHHGDLTGKGALSTPGSWCPKIQERRPVSSREYPCFPFLDPTLPDTIYGNLISRSLIKGLLTFTRPIFPLPGSSRWLRFSLGFICGFAPRHY